jgi:dihydrofolate synthase / folylpolyglutamate synthase
VPRDPERYLADLEPVGWSFGLERMKRLCAELGEPQRRFDSLHVVGTNGKSSVTTMCAALLAGTGRSTGACLSPHAWRWSERIRIDGAEIGEEAFAAAVEEVAGAIPAVEAQGAEGERVTQFEAAIAASFVAFARAGVDVAVIEAGLGGRLDATNVIPSRASALTSVALDHTDLLGETEAEIAAEKLAVLQPGTTLVIGGLSPEVERQARAHADALGAAVVAPPPLSPELLPPGIAPYLARNAAVALALAEIVAGPIPADVVSRALAATALPGRAERIPGEPPLLADAAHNEQGARALAEALPAFAGGRGVYACLSILADKDAEAITAALAPVLAGAVCTAADPGPAMGRPGAKARDPHELAALLSRAGVQSEVIADPAAAVERVLELAEVESGVAVCAGSHYLLRYAWTARRARNSYR